ncbi:MAG: hypothetical protein H6834_14455 [Planctomycetes bacterium]|nr:hypothetical protein [Planctomycetota bacterium]MCB9891915.1 hypothetical protein [Planctomycetota bacterium]
MFLHLASLALLTALSETPRPQDDPVAFLWKFEKGKTYEWALELESTRSMETEITVDGNPAEFGGPGGHETSRRRSVRHRDEVLDIAKGLPTQVKRTYDEVELSMSMGQEEEEPLTSPVVDHTIGIDARGDELELDIPEGLDLADEQRAAITLEPWLGNLLPKDVVAVGDSWDLDRKALLRVLNYGAGLYDFPEKRTIELPDGQTIEVPDPRRLAQAPPEEPWEGKCTLESVREIDGTRVATVTVEATLERVSEVEDGIEAEGGAIMIRSGGGEGEETLEGTLRFDLTNGRLLSLDLEGEIDLLSEMEHETEMGVFAMTSTTTGERHVSLVVREIPQSKDE